MNNQLNDEEVVIPPRNVKDPMMSHQEIMTELERSGQRSSGFYDEDARNLQQIYDAEYEDYAKKEREIRKQNKLRGQKLLLLQKKRILHERQKHEEADEVAADDQFQLWLELIHKDTTESTCLIEVNSVTARVLSISMWDNKSITALNLSRNNLNDFAGLRLGRMLKRNTALKKLELDTNNLGPRTCASLGESLKSNTTLKHLSMENNPVTKKSDGSSSYAGIGQLAASLTKNKTLVSLNLWRCNIGKEGGGAFVNALERNDTLVFLEVGNNGIPADCYREVGARLESNMKAERARQAERQEAEEKQAEEDAAKQGEEDKQRKQREFEQWLEDQKVERAEMRRKEIEDARIAAELAKEKREEEARQKAEKEKEEASKGKKKKGKKKK